MRRFALFLLLPLAACNMHNTDDRTICAADKQRCGYAEQRYIPGRQSER